MQYQKKYFNEIFEKLNKYEESDFEKASEILKEVEEKKSKIIIAGNGGSAAMASHVAVDFTKAAKFRAVNFNEADLITCYANDYGYEKWVVEALRSYCDTNDLVILISSSGNSENIVNAARYCIENKIRLITLSGFKKDNKLNQYGDVRFHVESNQYNIIEMVHHIWLLSIVDKYIEDKK